MHHPALSCARTHQPSKAGPKRRTAQANPERSRRRGRSRGQRRAAAEDYRQRVDPGLSVPFGVIDVHEYLPVHDAEKEERAGCNHRLQCLCALHNICYLVLAKSNCTLKVSFITYIAMQAVPDNNSPHASLQTASSSGIVKKDNQSP